jgi:pimeloyl-ACP methyl ester carboxylesterase
VDYDVSGQGPALMLLHSAGKTRQDWHKAGYVKRLETDFTVIAVDIRGSGESEFLTKISDFSIPNVSFRYSPTSRSRITLLAISSCFHSTVST